MKIGIIGGGIAGLAAGIGLLKLGMNVEIFEKAIEFSEIGAGLQISPNGHKILKKLGVSNAINQHAFFPQSIDLRFGNIGKLIASVPLGAAGIARWGAPYVHIRRSHLHDALCAQYLNLGGVLLHGYELNEVFETENKIQAHFLNQEKVELDYVIGADGVHSKMRGDGGARYTGYVAYRGILDARDLSCALPPSASVWAMRDQHVVTTFIDAGKTVNFVAISKGDWKGESWSQSADGIHLSEPFSGYAPVIFEIFERATKVNKWALLSRNNVQFARSKRSILIGDAAHAMLPSLAQGAVMGLEDADVLAKLLYEKIDLSELGATMQALRSKRVARVVAQSHANLTRFHGGNFGKHLKAFGARAFGESYFMKRQDWLFGHEIE